MSENALIFNKKLKNFRALGAVGASRPLASGG